MNTGRVARVARLEAMVQEWAAAREAELKAWWQGYRARVWTEADRLDLIETVSADIEGRTIDPTIEARADQAWGRLWQQAEGRDLANLIAFFGVTAVDGQNKAEV